MSKRPKMDESADSDDLQALFDSIASQPAAGTSPAVAVRADVVNAAADENADNDELQALFDAVAAEMEPVAHERSVAPAPTPILAAGSPATQFDEGAAVYNRLGQMTRQLHDSLRELGLDAALQDALQAMPDARERLDYIALMTEQAASRVLNATDIARPLQDRVEHGAQALHARWDKLFAGEVSVDEFRRLSGDTRDFLAQTESDSRAVQRAVDGDHDGAGLPGSDGPGHQAHPECSADAGGAVASSSARDSASSRQGGARRQSDERAGHRRQGP